MSHGGLHSPRNPSPLPDSTEVEADGVSTVTPKEGEGDSPPSRVNKGVLFSDNHPPGSVGDLMTAAE